MAKHKKTQHRKIWVFFVILVLLAVGFGSWGIYHHHEYQNLYFKFPDGSSVTMSRHNYNQMTAAEKQAFLHPVNENVLHACVGNPADQCLGSPSFDFWPAGSEAANNPQYRWSDAQSKEIMGRIASYEGDDVTIKTSSGRLVSIRYPLDAISNFNTTLTGYYGTVGLGDMLFVTYSADNSHDSSIVLTPQIARSSIILKNVSKKSPTVQKY